MLIDVAVSSGFSACSHEFVIAPGRCRGDVTCSKMRYTGDELVSPELGLDVGDSCESHRLAFTQGGHDCCLLMRRL
jgi:hypothetical protein